MKGFRKIPRQHHPERGSGRLRYSVVENMHMTGEPRRVVGRYSDAHTAAGMAAMLQRLGRDLRARGSVFGVTVHRQHMHRLSEPIPRHVKELAKTRKRRRGK